MAFFIQPVTTIRPRLYDPFEDMLMPRGLVTWPTSPAVMSVPAPTPEAIIPADSVINENGKFLIKCSVPGYDPADMKLDLDGNKLILSGERKTAASFQKIQRVFYVPDGVDKASFKCEFDPDTKQLCIEAASNSAPSIESKPSQPAVESQKQQPEAEAPQQTSEAQSKGYVERETDEGIEIDTTVSA